MKIFLQYNRQTGETQSCGAEYTHPHPTDRKDAEGGKDCIVTKRPPQKGQKKQQQKKRIWPYAVLGTLFIFLVAAAAGAFFAQKSLLDRPRAEHKEELLVAKDKATIMIMGIDERRDDVGRSDTLMVATIDPIRKEASLLSIPRDTRVSIGRRGYDKINAAYAYGGEKLTQETVEDFLGIRIDHYIIINTHAFQKIVDAIGGIDIDVEKRMYYEDPWDDDGGLIINLRPGLQHMDGKTAVTYVRYRDEEGDIGRVHRQQKFMRACVDAVTTPAILPRLPGIISSVIDSIKTDLSVRQLLEFVGTLKEAQANGLRTEMVPGRPLYIDEVSYWIPDMAQLRRAMVNTLGLTLSDSERSRMERAVRAYEESIPANATEIPAGSNAVGRAVSAEEAHHTGSRTSSAQDTDSHNDRRRSDAAQQTDDKGATEPRRNTGADTAPAANRRGDTRTATPNGGSAGRGESPGSAGGSAGSAAQAPTRGAPDMGKQE